MYKIELNNNEMSLKKTLNLKEVVGIGSFSAQENGGLSDMSITLTANIGETSINYGDIIELFKDTKLIYSGFVNGTNRVINSSGEQIEVKLVGLCSLFMNYNTNTNYNDTASNIFKSLIDEFNLQYGFDLFMYDNESIPDTIGIININLSEGGTLLEVMQKIATTANLKFFVGADRKVWLRGRGTTWNHSLALGNEIIEFSRENDGTDICNYLVLDWHNGSSIYQDETTQFKRKQIKISQDDISDQATADLFGNSYIDNYKDFTKKTTIVVGNKYDFFKIKPIDMVKIKNINEDVGLRQVAKINYSFENAKIELESYDSLGNIIFNK